MLVFCFLFFFIKHEEYDKILSYISSNYILLFVFSSTAKVLSKLFLLLIGGGK